MEQLFNVIPQWRLVEEHASPVEGKNQVRYFFCVLCVCIVAGVCLVAGCFFEKLKCMFAVFQKNQGGICRHSRFEARNESPMMRK